MLKIWSMKKDQAAAEKKKPKVTAAHIRLQKDMGELQLDRNTTMTFPDPNDRLNFVVAYRPPTGIYRGGEFKFTFTVSQNYPHEAPKVLCTQKIYHPNIDTEGHVCLNILREDWKPVLNIKSIIFGLQMLFLAPNPEDPLNKEAAEHMFNNRGDFEMAVSRAMNGGFLHNIHYDNVHYRD
ncbi:NEDD8-conjugating protein ubc12 [Linderina pennispora]|nr:NEDD8-conjugating protein ubc12 [Linderina pennispora]